MTEIRGAYAAVLMDENHLFAFRDPKGFRPLVIGKPDHSFCLASETAALDTVGASLVREVEPGEIVTYGQEGLAGCSGKETVYRLPVTWHLADRGWHLWLNRLARTVLLFPNQKIFTGRSAMAAAATAQPVFPGNTPV